MPSARSLGRWAGDGDVYAHLCGRAAIPAVPGASTDTEGPRFASEPLRLLAYEENTFQCPSETTSTVPSMTLMAVASSIAYARP
jgi:hypothetical protein